MKCQIGTIDRHSVRSGARRLLSGEGHPMKPCPQCGAPLHFAANRWIHSTPCGCLLITLHATPEEIACYGTSPTLAGARYRTGDAGQEREWKFRYLAPSTDGAPPLK